MSDFGPRGDYGRVRERPYRRGGYDRERRLQTTIVVGAVILLLVGFGVGFSLGRATAPKAAPNPVPVVQTETTLSAEPTLTPDTSLATETVSAADTSSAEAPTADTTRPPKPKQTAPANGAVINASRVTLRWTKVTDDSGEPVTYSFEIQNRHSGGTYGDAQIIKGLKTTSYSARVLSVRRRWRVWAVDSAGNASAKSVWHSYIHKIVTPAKSTTSSSTTTSGTTN